MKDPRCLLGLHAWPRIHGYWREPVVQPAEAHCTRCGKPLQSVWRTAYPEDGSRCDGSCPIHSAVYAEHGSAGRDSQSPTAASGIRVPPSLTSKR